MSSTTTKNYVPASFVNPLVKAWDVLSQTLTQFNPRRVFITGHSLGGAYATLLGFILAECRVANFPAIESIHIVSFGAPTLLGDGARNTFNAHLDSGKVTLDRVVSYANVSRTVDPITKIPAGFSHPGFQPLQTELYPETTTGRAYHLDMIKKVYQVGGVFGPEKSKYIAETKTHMPNKVMIPATSPLAQAFPHKQYYVSWNTAYVFRTAGMKNPGFKGNTFVADLLTDGIRFQYVSGDPNAVEDPTETTTSEPAPPPTGGRTPRNKKRNETYKQKRL
jgi:pimeloyl-ACP methyl ester carboxylesterase